MNTTTPGTTRFSLIGIAMLAGLGLALPGRRIVANLSPADLPKEGSHYDLPIALALMITMGILPADALDGWAVMG